MPRKKEKKSAYSNPVEVVPPHEYTCCLCGKTFIGWSNNPAPLGDDDDECCNECNYTKVIPARMEQMIKEYEKEHGYDKSTV